jgi:FemAB-related protein (PEP-CTERM system-associated)
MNTAVQIPEVRTEINHLAAGEESEWDAFVQASPQATFFHLSRWARIVEEVLGRRCHLLVARTEGSISGVFPVAHVRSRIFGDSLVSLPLAVYGGVCAEDAGVYERLLHAGRDLGRRLDVNFVEMRNRTDTHPSRLPGRDLYVTFTQDLRPGPDAIMRGLPRDTRYAVRKSLKAGLTWSEDVTDGEFYAIVAQSFRNLGTPIFPRSLFARLRADFGERCRVFGARKGSALIAAVLCFYFRDEVMPYYAGALPAFYADCPNNFMYWKLICQSYDEGYRIFDFGRSKRGTGSCQFKSSWSMEATPLPYRYHLIRSKEVPEMSAADGKFRLAASIWKRLPAPAAAWLGPRVIRMVPSL